MSRWKQKKRNWEIRKAQKSVKHRHKRKTHQSKNTSIHKRKKTSIKLHGGKQVEVKFIVPRHFSLIDNTEETMDFFEEIIKEMKKKQHGKCFNICSASVETVTVDALIYLIALMENSKISLVMHYNFYGDFPSNEKARNIYRESGFESFVKSKMKKLPHNTEKMQIVRGINNDPKISSEFCKFVMRTLQKERVEILHLQKTFVELMSNVVSLVFQFMTAVKGKPCAYAPLTAVMN